MKNKTILIDKYNNKTKVRAILYDIAGDHRYYVEITRDDNTFTKHYPTRHQAVVELNQYYFRVK